MEHGEFVAILTPLVLAMRAEFDQPTWGAYHRALQDVPESVLALAVDSAMREPREFFPKAGELRAMCERQRRYLLAANRYEGCVDCEDSKGWRATLIAGVPKVEKCPCSERYKAKLETMGLLAAISPLPGETTGESEQVFLTLEQLPQPIQERLRLVAGQKVLR